VVERGVREGKIEELKVNDNEKKEKKSGDRQRE
jgi:hypothetical protein